MFFNFFFRLTPAIFWSLRLVFFLECMSTRGGSRLLFAVEQIIFANKKGSKCHFTNFNDYIVNIKPKAVATFIY